MKKARNGHYFWRDFTQNLLFPCAIHFFFLLLQRKKFSILNSIFNSQFSIFNSQFPPMTTQAMTQLLADYFKTQPVTKAWLFGSYARGEQRPDSDVDIMVAFTPNAHVGLFQFSGMNLALQDLLHKRVDLVTEKGLMSFARNSVNRDKQLIYERAN